MFLTANLIQFLSLTTIAAVTADAAPSSSRPQASDDRHVARSSNTDGSFDGCLYQVEGAGAFSSHFSFDFTSMDVLPDELIASTYEVGSGPWAPYSHIFEPANIVLGSGQPMQMIVPGGQTADPLSTCQLVTRYDDVLYASVRTVAQVSPVNGTVHGFFMYMNDTQETDIEIRTGDLGNVHFTNQQTHYGNGETTYAVAAPSTMTSAFHEYRYDWLPTVTNFYIDGVLVMSINRNVPTEPGWLMWNNWASGGAWTYGPPLQDNVLLVQSVEAYFNRTSIDTSQCEASAAASTGVASASTTSAGTRVTTNAAAVSSHESAATAAQTSTIDAGTSTLSPTTEAQTSVPTTSAINGAETSKSTTLDDSSTNTAQMTSTTGTVFDSTGTATATSTAYAGGSTPVVAGVAFSVETDTAYSGTLLSIRTKRAGATVDDCMRTCAGSSDCVGTAYVNGSSTCSYYSAFDKDTRTTNMGSTFAAVQDRDASSSEASSAPTTSISSLSSATDGGMSTTASAAASSSKRATASTMGSASSVNTASSATTVLLSVSSSTSSATTTPTPTVSITCPEYNNTLYNEPTSGTSFRIECGIDHAGGDLSMVYVSDLAGCIDACAQTTGCVDVSLSGAACYMKKSVGAVVDSNGIMGAKLVTSTSSVASSTSSGTAATYTRPPFQQLLKLHIDARLVVPTSA